VTGKVFPEEGKFFPAANEAATGGTEESEREALGAHARRVSSSGTSRAAIA
jgi:hypothetical protein